MTDEIIEMARDSDMDLYGLGKDRYRFVHHLKAFAKLVAQHEREKALQLWMLLDDIDTADDIAKADNAVYRSLCRQIHAKRWSVLTGDEVDAAIRARGEA
jgi:hypothetical protein